MHSINKKWKKSNQDLNHNVSPEQHFSISGINHDIICVLSSYDKRIHFKLSEHGTSRKYANTKILCSEKNILDKKLFFNPRLTQIFFKSVSNVNLDQLKGKQIKTLQINQAMSIRLSSNICNQDTTFLHVEQIRIVNCNISLDTFSKVLSIQALKSLTLKNVNIYCEPLMLQKEKNMYIVSSQSDELSENEIVPLIKNPDDDLYHEDVINQKLLNLFKNLNLKKLTLLNSNIRIESIETSGLMKKLNVFKYKKKDAYVYFSFARELFSYYKTNLTTLYFDADIEYLHITNLKILHRHCNFSSVKKLCIFDNHIKNDLVILLFQKFTKVRDFGLVNCTFTDGSFRNFVKTMSSQIRYLNLIDSELPLDSLNFLRKTLRNCKVIFRDKSIFECKNIS